MALSVSATVFLLGVPFRGSLLALVALSSAYLAVMLGLGLLISTVTRNQFAASQAALIAGFLPAFELSGFIFEIDSMPRPMRLLTYVLPPRYFVSSLQTLFLAGDVAERPRSQRPGARGHGRRSCSSRSGEKLACDWSSSMWLRIRSLIVKELLAIWRDPKSRFILLGPPVIELLIFAYAATQEVKNVRIAILNQDMGIYARDLVARFEGSPNFRSVRHLAADADVAPAIDSRSVLLVVHIRQDFSRLIAARQPAAVQLILDGRSSNTSQILAGYARGDHRRLQRRAGAPRAHRRRRPAPWWLESGSTPTWTHSGARCPASLAILVALEGLMVTALSVARERELGTFEQLLVSPLSPAEIVIGKTVPAMLIGLGEGTLVLAVATLYFRVPLTGSLWLLYAGDDRLPARRGRQSACSSRRWLSRSSRPSSARSPSWCRWYSSPASPARSRTCPTGSRPRRWPTRSGISS